MSHHPAKCGKLLGKVSDGENRDMISSLPDELLGHILSFLPTKIAVGTSVLSTRWRYMFRLTNTLDFDGPRLGCDLLEKDKLRRDFKMFIYRVLALHSFSPLRKFKLVSLLDYLDLHLHAWISVVILKGVYELDIYFYSTTRSNALPHSLFNSETLVILKITSPRYEFRAPDSICLPRLKVLCLEFVVFQDRDSVSRVISCCPVLEDLTLCPCYWALTGHIYIYAEALKKLTIICPCGDISAEVEIDAPSLASLTYDCHKNSGVSFYLTNSSPLLNARMQLTLSINDNLVSRALKLVRDASSVTRLYLLCDTLLGLTYAKHVGIPAYLKLATLYLGDCSYDSWEFVTYWLANSPQLETVQFGQGLINCGVDKEWPANVALVPFSSHVRKIVVYDFGGRKPELVALKYLIKYATVLKMGILYKHHSMTMRREVKVSKKLLMLPRASKCCRTQLKAESYPISRYSD